MICPLALIPSCCFPYFLFPINMHPFALILSVGWIGGFFLFLSIIHQGYIRAYKMKWYDLSPKGPDEDLDWDEIKTAMEDDALDRKSRSPWTRLRPDRWRMKPLLIHLIFVATSLLLLWGIGDLICKVHDDLTNSNNVDYLESLGVLIGGLAVGVAGFSIFYQGRLKARSENRHAWITSIRKEIADLVADFPNTTGKCEKSRSSLTRLELSLNPNERIHRALLAILRSMCGLEDNGLDRVPRCKLCIPGNLLADEAVQQEWKVRVTRLATVLLKREWERVKDVR